MCSPLCSQHLAYSRHSKVFVDGLIGFLLFCFFFFFGGGLNLILVVLVEPTLKLGKLLLVPLRGEILGFFVCL